MKQYNLLFCLLILQLNGQKYDPETYMMAGVDTTLSTYSFIKIIGKIKPHLQGSMRTRVAAGLIGISLSTVCALVSPSPKHYKEEVGANILLAGTSAALTAQLFPSRSLKFFEALPQRFRYFYPFYTGASLINTAHKQIHSNRK